MKLCLLCLAFTGAAWAQASLTPNRTLPRVEPPSVALKLSAQPSADEIFRVHIFEEPLVPIGGEPGLTENAALASALLAYAHRRGQDDFSSLTGFLEKYPHSPWCAALLTDLGLEYYNTAHYSLAIEAWQRAWSLAKDATHAKGRAVAGRAVGELAYMYARLGRMNELDSLFKSVDGRSFAGPASGKLAGAREGLWSMQDHPEVSFRCGPMALRSIQVSRDPNSPLPAEILNSASTQRGFSLPQVAGLSKKIGMNYQMAFRDGGSERLTVAPSGQNAPTFVVPSVVHWKVGHYAALVRKEGDLYLLQDPTFGNETWATREALEAETSGYFLIPPGPLPNGWRAVDEKEGGAVWGRGTTSMHDDRNITRKDLATHSGDCHGMAVPTIHLMTVNLILDDEPLGYTPPVGPAVRLRMRFNHRDSFQPANFTYSNFGSKWTCDWISYVTDNPSNALADVKHYPPGGGERSFTGFATNTQSASQQYDETILKRTGSSSYELISGDGSKLVFAQPDGSIGTSRKIFLTQMLDPAGNAVMLTYDSNLRLVALTDAIGQVTTLTYGLSDDIYKVTQVTDPFGRFATFNYQQVALAWTYIAHNDCPQPSLQEIPTRDTWLQAITDVIGLSSQFGYLQVAAPGTCAGCLTNPATRICAFNNVFLDFISKLTTPYGTTEFTNQDSGNTRVIEIIYPDASRERVEYNQSYPIPNSDPVAKVPQGLTTANIYLAARNTFHWSRTACALGYGDISKARLYHWLHADTLASTTSGALESFKEPLEGRVWFDYAGQNLGGGVIAPNTQPVHAARVLDDGTTQLYTYAYNALGNVTTIIDPVGRTLSYIYATNGIDLLEVRQTRAGKSELLFNGTYNAQHLPLTLTDAAGQTTTFTYNARGQRLTEADPKNQTTTFTYDTNGYLVIVDGPLPGTNDLTTATYNAFGRLRTTTDDSGYTITFDYDALDRPTRMTFPDSTFIQATYDRLDLAVLQSRAGQQTRFEYDRLRQVSRRIDALGRETRFEWCRCGALHSLIDPMGRVTAWESDVQGRPIAKIYSDGSKETYDYETTTSRLRQFTDEKHQAQLYTYNRDNTLKSISYVNSIAATPNVSYTYDPDYERISSMTDGLGTTLYSYNPITGASVPGAGSLAGVDGPLAKDTITYAYDELGRRIWRGINGVGLSRTFDAAGRLVAETNALGNFTYSYDGASSRIVLETLPNNLTVERGYKAITNDLALERITHKTGGTPLSEFLYDRDTPRNRITGWSQQAGAQPTSRYALTYDDMDQLLSVFVTNSGALAASFAYGHDGAGNRLSEITGGATNLTTYNSLNQISSISDNGMTRSNEWNAEDRLVAVTAGTNRTEIAYDGLGRLAAIRQLVNGIEVSSRRLVWCDDELCEERDSTGATVTRRYFAQGMKVESGPQAGAYYYSRDHLGSVRELTDGGGNLRARYAYDPYGRQTRIAGDVDGDFGFAGMFTLREAGLVSTRFRAYSPPLGRWLSRDPLDRAELSEGPNLYTYVRNDPVNRVDPLGLRETCCGDFLFFEDLWQRELQNPSTQKVCDGARRAADLVCKLARRKSSKKTADSVCAKASYAADHICNAPKRLLEKAIKDLQNCMIEKCVNVCVTSSFHETTICELWPKQ